MTHTVEGFHCRLTLWRIFLWVDFCLALWLNITLAHLWVDLALDLQWGI